MRSILTAVIVLCLVAAGVPPVSGAAGPGPADRTDPRPVSPAVDATPRAAQADANDSTANTTTVTLLSYNDVQTAAAEDGNLSRLVTLIDRRRTAHANPAVVAGAGDQVGPHALSPVSQWRAPVDVLNLIGPDADVIGNHEFDYGYDEVSNFTAASEFPWLATNLVNASTGEAFDGTRNYTLVTQGNVTVGIIGLVDYGATYGKTNINFSAEGARLENYTEAGPETARFLKEQKGADVVVALAHTGVPDAKTLAREDTGDYIDVIAVGDDEIYYPPNVTAGSIITEGEARAAYLGELNLTVDTEANDVTSWDGRLIPVTDDVPKNETASRIIDDYRSEVSLDENITYSEEPLDARFDSNYHRETNYGNLITDAFRAETGADVAITNAGGIRSNQVYGPGNITGGDVFNTLPFPNTLVTVEFTGAELKETLASQVITFESETGQEYGPEIQQQVSGVQFEWVAHEGVEPKVRDVWVNRADPDEPPRWEPLDENATYEVTVNSFMADGGSGYPIADTPRVNETDVLYAEAVVDYLESKERVSPTVEGRMRRVDTDVDAESVSLEGGNATVTLAAPANASDVNASSFYLRNETGVRVVAESVTFDAGNGTITATFGGEAAALSTPGGDVDLYGDYTDTRWEGDWIYWSSAVLSAELDVSGDEPGNADATSVLSVSSTSVSNGGTGTMNLTLTTTEGFSGGQLTVSVSNGSVANVTTASYADSLGLTRRPVIDANGSSVQLRAADVEGAIQPGATDARLATITVRGEAAGTSAVTVSVSGFDNETGGTADLAIREGQVSVGPEPVVSGRSPTDSDGDGLYEDVNGNGRADYDDVVVLFENLNREAITANAAAYDFNGNGRLDYDDVVELYATL
jgi:2',3'-cyclic-nucleotide 2'-phosphodiesterase (5'-nucleotidase family)